MTKTVECASGFGSARDETVSAMGSSSFTKLRLRACAKEFRLLTIGMNSCLASVAPKPRFRQGKLLFVLFRSSLHR